ncbi:hypothetical protein BGZ52_002726 [Haplosporangium bisporale]|nr:hypothetical protein BGZ52_002726 [Haplosporangium bisporale]KFH68348.1 hypothetical protein MVEG_05166 [Podila verticillata NRRL 6337]
MLRLHPQRRGGATNNAANPTHRSQTYLPHQTHSSSPNSSSHTSSFSFRPNTNMRRPLPDSDLDDFEPLPDVNDLFDDPPEGLVRQATKRERDSGKSGKSVGSGSTMAHAPTTATTVAKRARVSARIEPTTSQTWHEHHGEISSGPAHLSFDDDDIDFELDMLSHDDDHHQQAPLVINKSASVQEADRSYSTMLSEAVQQVDGILMSSSYDPYDPGNNSTRASSTLSQGQTGFPKPLEARDEHQEHGHRSNNESLSDDLNDQDKEETVRDPVGGDSRQIGTEQHDQGTEDRSADEAAATGDQIPIGPSAPAYSFTTPTSVGDLEERLRETNQLLCSTFNEIVASVREVEDLRSSVKKTTDAHFQALDMRDGRIQARKAEVRVAATSIQSRGPVDFSSTNL